MKEQLKQAVAEIDERLGNLEGFILIALDESQQANYLVGKCGKMVCQLTRENAEMMETFEEGIKKAKLHKKLDAIIEEAKELGFDPDKDYSKSIS